MERLTLTVLLCLGMASLLHGQGIVDVTNWDYRPMAEDGCCQRTEEITQAIGGDSSCQVQIRGCEFGCSRCSNQTGSITLGNSATSFRPVCPAETSAEAEVCCKPAETQRRYKYCSGTWYSYEYPLSCDCGPCEYLTDSPKCRLYEYEAYLIFYINHLRCNTREPIRRRHCRGYCSTSEHSYIVVMSSPVTSKIPVYRKDCRCCEADTYEVLQNVRIDCPIPGTDWLFTYTSDIQIILTCDCNYCRSKPLGVQTIEDEQMANDEPVEFANVASLDSAFRLG